MVQVSEKTDVAPSKPTYGLKHYVIGGVVAVVLVFLAAWGISYGINSGWTAEQWGPAAGWVAATVTFAAVLLAFRQNQQTRHDLEFERKLAKQRHDQVVAQARLQMRAQHGLEQKNAQIAAVRAICDAGSQISVRTYQLITVGLNHVGDQNLVTERRQKWIAELNPEALTMRLSLVGLSDSDLMETAQEVVGKVGDIVKLAQPTTVGEATDWPAVSAEVAKFMMKLEQLQFTLVAKTQPAFYEWAIKQGDMTPKEPDAEPSKGPPTNL